MNERIIFLNVLFVHHGYRGKQRALNFCDTLKSDFK